LRNNQRFHTLVTVERLTEALSVEDLVQMLNLAKRLTASSKDRLEEEKEVLLKQKEVLLTRLEADQENHQEGHQENDQENEQEAAEWSAKKQIDDNSYIYLACYQCCNMLPMRRFPIKYETMPKTHVLGKEWIGVRTCCACMKCTRCDEERYLAANPVVADEVQAKEITWEDLMTKFWSPEWRQ
jgi:hypothetical protein